MSKPFPQVNDSNFVSLLALENSTKQMVLVSHFSNFYSYLTEKNTYWRLIFHMGMFCAGVLKREFIEFYLKDGGKKKNGQRTVPSLEICLQ